MTTLNHNALQNTYALLACLALVAAPGCAAIHGGGHHAACGCVTEPGCATDPGCAIEPGCSADCGDSCGGACGDTCGVDGRSWAFKRWTDCNCSGPKICVCTGPCGCDTSEPGCGCAEPACGCAEPDCGCEVGCAGECGQDCCVGGCAAGGSLKFGLDCIGEELNHVTCGLIGKIGCGGCDGESYWSEWHNDPPRCKDPCDRCGNWVGPSTYRAPYAHPYGP
ncbi:hypothetical protein Mal64_09660 [Pseudobythopirellula maris]|uniref:Stigma-specific protein, Stig1 n=1 Tax=Pseudobythopirellula maris TaxID=2527991 RepID=A0A5C5ZSQ7_9BACT|nr:hypothetical protein [Pseudobythopirellula maris]TWT90572.1 hypothetical protein Mal64_09660 [Pseudobythopirellula maris]